MHIHLKYRLALMAALGTFCATEPILFVQAAAQNNVDKVRVEHAMAQTYAPIDLSGFRDSIHHYRMKAETTGKLDYQRYRPEQIVSIAENLLFYQTPEGGWPKNVDWLRVRNKADVLRPSRDGALNRGVFDNRNTYPQVEYLARVFRVVPLDRYRQACVRGIDFMLREQRPSGGWRGTDVDAITFNDEVTTGVLNTLMDIAQARKPFGFIDSARRQQARLAVRKGIACILACQIQVNGQRTAWCQQHSHRDFLPVGARSYEKPSISGSESVAVVEFLLRIEDPSPEIIQAVKCAVAWLERVKIEGIRVDEIEAKPITYSNHVSRTDKIVVHDPNAPPIWARYYDLKTGRPFFCNRDGHIVHTLAEVRRERRTGYAWYGYWPAKLLDKDYPRWRQKLLQNANPTSETKDAAAK